jgi:catechol 2,3-dioxygenase-like lactoylglutathione lyase family enzyme
VFAHVTLSAADRSASELFYDLVLGVLGIERTAAEEGFTDWQDLRVVQSSGPDAVTRGLHIGFVAPTREEVDEFWRVGTEAGYQSDGEPGPRPQYREDYYGSFLLDPDGNSAEAVHHGALRRGGVVDHLWIRVPDVDAARERYLERAPHEGFRLRPDTHHGAQFVGDGGSFSLVEGEPTQNVQMEFE